MLYQGAIKREEGDNPRFDMKRHEQRCSFMFFRVASWIGRVPSFHSALRY
jgi:hypothetical protein